MLIYIFLTISFSFVIDINQEILIGLKIVMLRNFGEYLNLEKTNIFLCFSNKTIRIV